MLTTNPRIDQALYDLAKTDAAAEHHSTGQVEYWAKLGRAALDNPDLPVSFRRILCRNGRTTRTKHPLRPKEPCSMSYGVRQTRRFARHNKLLASTAADVDTAVEEVAADPSIGERKKGDLADLLVHQFRSQGQLYLLGYTLDDEVKLVYLEALGPHEEPRHLNANDPG